jgi:hypothetical protein
MSGHQVGGYLSRIIRVSLQSNEDLGDESGEGGLIDEHCLRAVRIWSVSVASLSSL